MWLVEAAGLRLLCDPTLERTHHGDVFEVVPPRRIQAAALRPDFILVSHRHTDHFDVPSLHRLARLDPESVVVTPDELVAWACRELGFRTVHVVPPGQRIELDGLTLVTTPSVAPMEWGVAIASDDGAVWNQVDTVLEDADAMRAAVGRTLEALGREDFALALVRWHPLLEIAAQMGYRTGFPYRDYAGLLEQIAAVPTRALVPASAGAAHHGPHRWMDRHAYPLPEARFCRDVAARCPGVEVWPSGIGDVYEVEAGQARRHAGAGLELVEWLEGPTPPESRIFEPLATPALRDTNPRGHAVSSMWTRVEAWVAGDLSEGLHRELGQAGPLRLGLRVVGPSETRTWTLRVRAEGVQRTDGLDPDWDGLNAIPLSGLYAVLEGERHWGDVLLAGDLRGRTRAYGVSSEGLRRADLAELFLYYGLGYAEAEERNARAMVRRALEAEAAESS